jgi:hypothetical protein
LNRSSESGCYRLVLARDQFRTLKGNIDLLGGEVCSVVQTFWAAKFVV